MKNLKPKKTVVLIALILLSCGAVDLTSLYFNNKYKPTHEPTLRLRSGQEATSQEPSYDLEEVFEAFIEEEAYNPEEHVDENLEEAGIHLSGWIAYWDFSSALNTYKANTEVLESLSPTWYYLKADGTLGLKSTARNSELINLCAANDTKLIPTISNSNAEELSQVLNNQSLLNTHINTIVNEVNTYNYNGVDIDYEHIKATDKDAFTNFVKQLAEELHNNNKILTIAILWKNDLEDLIEIASKSRAAQDWNEIGKHVDEFRIMAYNYTSAAGQAGPIAPSDWIRSILDYAYKNIDNHNVIALGLPFYAYEWSENVKGAKALIWNDVNNIKNNLQSSTINDQLDSNYLEKELKYYAGDIIKIIWYQDSEVTQKRIELAKTYGVNKFIFWRLGGEDPQIWQSQI